MVSYNIKSAHACPVPLISTVPLYPLHLYTLHGATHRSAACGLGLFYSVIVALPYFTSHTWKPREGRHNIKKKTCISLGWALILTSGLSPSLSYLPFTFITSHHILCPIARLHPRLKSDPPPVKVLHTFISKDIDISHLRTTPPF